MWLKKILWSILFGVIAAIIFVLLNSNIRKQLPIFTPQVVSYRDAVRVASPAVVNVYNESFAQVSGDNHHQVNNLGSGVIMSRDGYILTNKHVIQNAEQIIVALQNGQIFAAKLIGSDSVTDLAVLKIKAKNLPVIPQNLARKNHVGDVVLSIGNPYNLGQSVSLGIISALGRNVVSDSTGRQDFIQTDASINRGNSGGALINSLGELVGISTLSIGKNSQDMAEGLNFAIPIDLANEIMYRIIKDGRVIRGYLGVQSDILFNNGQGVIKQGVLVTAVAPASPAAIAGIQAGDLITKFDDIKIKTPVQLIHLISRAKPNTTAKITLNRLGKILTLPVTITEYSVENNK